MVHSPPIVRIVSNRLPARKALRTARASAAVWAAFCGAPLVAGLLLGLAPRAVAETAAGVAMPAIAMHGAPALPEGFAALPYANPGAPKGGRLVEGVLGTFDSLNPLIVQGLAVQPIRGYVVESLMARGYDEPFTLYGLLARTIETDDARSYVSFAIDPAAHFSDGTPVTAEDVVFSWQLLRDHGRPNHRTYYSKVAKAEILGTRSVRFDFADAGDRELPLILGLMPILPKHAVDVATFENSTLAKPVGSGPYVVADVDVGKSVTFKRDPNYWGRDLAINRGLWNFDELRFDFYRDENAYFEGFKAGLYDVRSETDPGRWQTGYDFPAGRDGRVVKEAFSNGLPKFASDYVFNTRRPIFSDIRVRQAIALLFDFEWINRNFFYDLYRRSASFFDDSELSAYHRPADARERALLAPYPERFAPTCSTAPGRRRSPTDRAATAHAASGARAPSAAATSSRARHCATTERHPLAFELMVTNRDDERLALVFAESGARRHRGAGAPRRCRAISSAPAVFDFDMIEYRWEQSLSPGNEQAFLLGLGGGRSARHAQLYGRASAAVDAMIAAMLRRGSVRISSPPCAHSTAF